MRWLKYAGWTLLSVMVLFMLVGLGLLSPPGTRLALGIMNDQLDALTLEDVSGSFFSRVNIARVQWQDDSIDVTLNKLEIAPDWDCMLSGKVCLNRLAIDQIQGSLLAPAVQEEDAAASAPILPLRLAVSIQELALGKLDFSLAPDTAIHWQALKTQLHINNSLEIPAITVSDLRITLPARDAAQQPPADFAAIANWRFQPVSLPGLVLPLVARLGELHIQGASVLQGDASLVKFNSIKLRGHMEPTRILLSRLALESDAGRISGTLAVADNYQLTSQLLLQPADPNLPQAQLVATGSPAQLELKLTSKEDDSLALAASLDLTSTLLPLSLEANWKNLNLPIAGDTLHSRNGHISVQGDLSHIAIESAAKFSWQQYSDLPVSLSSSGNLARLSLHSLALDSPFLTTDAQGKLTLSDTLDLSVQLKVNRFSPSGLPDSTLQKMDYPGLTDSDIHGTINFDVRYTNTGELRIDSAAQMAGKWMDSPANLTLNGQFDSQQGANVKQLNLQIAENQLTAQGTLDASQILGFQANIRAPRLDQLWPAIEGSLTSDLQISKSLAAPTLTMTAHAVALQGFDLAVERVNSQFTLEWTDDPLLEADMRLENVLLAGTPLATIHTTIAGTPEQHQIAIEASGERLNGNSQFNGQATQSSWQGQWASAEWQFDQLHASLSQPDVDIQADWQTGRYKVLPHCWALNGAPVCVETLRFWQDKLSAAFSGQELALVSWLKPYIPQLQQIETDSLVTFDAQLDWSGAEQLEANLNLEASPAQWTFADSGFQFQIDKLAAAATARGDKVDSELDLVSQQLGSLKVELDATTPPENRSVKAHVVAQNLLLGPWQGFIPQLDELEGRINADTHLSVAGQQVQVKGQADLADANVSLGDLHLRNIEQQAQFNGDHLTTSGTFMLGEGEGLLAGSVFWSPEVKADFTLSGEQLTYNDNHRIDARISPDIRLHYAQNTLNIDGNLALPYARLKIASLPESAVVPSRDTEIISPSETVREDAMVINLDTRLVVDPEMIKEVKIDAFGLKGSLAGDIQLVSRDGEIQALGDLSLLNGTYKSFGQNLQIRQGDVLFNGPLTVPTLSVEAIRDPQLTEDGVTAGVQISGIASQPDVNIFSDPVMPQPQALSYLIRGHGIDANNADEQDTLLTNILLGISLGQGENTISRLGDSLGVRDLTLETRGQGDDTKLAVSGTIAPGVKLSYGVGVFDSASEVTLRYQLMPQLYLEAVSGVNSALDLFYQFTSGETQSSGLHQSKSGPTGDN